MVVLVVLVDIVRSFETLKTKFQKVTLDMKFIKSRKGEGFIPTFASVLLLIKQHNPKLKT